MNPINSTASSARENRVKERNQKRSALQDVTNSKQQNNIKRAKDTVDPPVENGSSTNSANDNEHNNVQNSVLLPNLTHVMNGTNSESSNIKEWLRQLVVAQVSELSKPQLNSTVGTNDPIIHENNNQTKESPSMSIFGNLAVGGNSNPENQDKSLALHDDESLVHSAMAASSSGPNQHENDMQSDINLPTFLGRVTKVKREDAKYSIVHRFYVKLCQFDFCGAANSPLNSTKYSKFNALNTFKTWADAAETSNYSLALMISNTTDLARNYSAVITDSEEVPPFFDTTQLHGFCAVASSNFPKLVSRYEYLVNIWNQSKNGAEVSLEDQRATVLHLTVRGDKSVSEDDEHADIDQDGNLFFPFDNLLYNRMYRCLESMKSKWRKKFKKINSPNKPE